jgi:hypothetical protein
MALLDDAAVAASLFDVVAQDVWELSEEVAGRALAPTVITPALVEPCKSEAWSIQIERSITKPDLHELHRAFSSWKP